MNKTILLRTPLNQLVFPETYHPVLKRIFTARSLQSLQELDYRTQYLHHYRSLRGISQAVELLAQAIFQQKHILIVADYDADGATSCALAVKALKQMGAWQVSYLVPHREKHGYGLTLGIVQLALTQNPDLLITVDNGISNREGVQLAKSHGVQVLITDHHLSPPELPPADAIVNPNQPQDTFPSKALCGVGVIFYVMTALRAHLDQQKWFDQKHILKPVMGDFLDLVALGTVADVVPLDYNNRILVDQGLRRIRQGYSRHGIKALITVSKRDAGLLTAADLAFSLGPRLNAAGRMDDMSYGINCLLSEGEEDALRYAQLLDDFNQERRGREAEMQQDALQMIEELQGQGQLGKTLCLYAQDWHEGVIGILASRIKEHLHRPVIIFTTSATNSNQLKGSARSVEGVHIRDILANINTQFPNMIQKFGGHAMAAGLTLPHDQLDLFRQTFEQQVGQCLSEEDLQGITYTDGRLEPEDFNAALAEQLKTITPWGQQFPEPLFEGEFQLVDRRVIKKQHLKMSVRPFGQPVLPIEAMAFNTLDTDWPLRVNQVYLVYRLDINVFRGFKSLQLIVEEVIPM